MTYNLTNLTASNNLLEFAIATNDLTGGSYFVLVLIGIFLVAFTILLSRYQMADSLLSSSIITLIAATMLFFTGLISEGFLLGTFVIFLAAALLRLNT